MGGNDPGFGRARPTGLAPKTHSVAILAISGVVPAHALSNTLAQELDEGSLMKTYIPKQPKHQRERVEAKLDERLVRKLERYCEYLDSDRDYVLSQALEIAFKKDKAFGEWLARQGALLPAHPPAARPREKEA